MRTGRAVAQAVAEWVAVVALVATLRQHPYALVAALVAVGVWRAHAMRGVLAPLAGIGIAACGVVGEWLVVSAGGWHYPDPGALPIPLWVPALWYLAVTRLLLLWEAMRPHGGARAHEARWPALSTDTIRLESGVATALVVSACLYWDAPVTLAAVAAALSLLVLWVRNSSHLAVVYAAGALMGTTGAVVFTHLSVWTHGEPTSAALPAWLPFAWGLVSVLVIRLALSGPRTSGPPIGGRTSARPHRWAESGVCAVVPARNEASTVGDVVRVLRTVPCVGEVIVVDNDSSDGTADVARRAGAVVLLEPEVGKGQAMMRGAAASDADVLLFVDADLVRLNRTHVEVLVASVVTGQSDMACGLWDRGPAWNWILCNFVPIVTGQRAVRRELFASLSLSGSKGYRVEASLNAHVARQGGRRAVCILDGLGHRPRAVKIGSRVSGILHVWRVILVGSWAAVMSRLGPPAWRYPRLTPDAGLTGSLVSAAGGSAEATLDP